MARARIRPGNPDRLLYWLVILLMSLGVVAVFNATYARSTSQGQYHYLILQTCWAAIAFGALHAGMRLPFPLWRRLWLWAPLAGIALLGLTMAIGPEINGAKRWLQLGPVTIQPSELAKLATVVFIAGYSALMRSHIQQFWKGFLPVTLVLGLLAALVAAEDLGTAISLVITGLLMLFVAGARFSHLCGLTGLGAGAVFWLVWIVHWRKERIDAWLDPLAHYETTGYQVWQGLLTLGSGQLTGRGFTQGVGKHFYLPAAHNDYIFATIGEEFGLVGALVILGLFMALVTRGLMVAHRSRDWFGGLLALGVVGGVGIQALLNIAVVTASLPATGLPLPFISYGGSSLVVTAFSLGIVLNVSAYAAAAAEEERNVREASVDRWGHRRAHLSRS